MDLAARCTGGAADPPTSPLHRVVWLTGTSMPRTDPTWLLRRPLEGFYTSHVEAPEVLPVRTFLPTGYEPHYPYPLLVFLHGHGGSEEQVMRLAPRVSRRNFIAVGLRGPG